jgi:hypothetical protein
MDCLDLINTLARDQHDALGQPRCCIQLVWIKTARISRDHIAA